MSRALSRESLADTTGSGALDVPAVGTRTTRSFAPGIAAFVILLHLLGFGPSLVDDSVRNAPVSPLVHAHTVVAGGWLLLFLVQTLLVATRQTAVHRRVGGLLGPVLTLAMIALIVPTVMEMSARGYDLSGDISRGIFAPGAPLTADERIRVMTVRMLAPLLGTINFGVLVGIGLWYRHRPAIHGRLMLLGLLTLALVPLIHLRGHIVAHWPLLYGPGAIAVPILGNLLLFGIAAREWVTRTSIHPLSIWVPSFLIIETALVLGVVSRLPSWQRVALWLVS